MYTSSPQLIVFAAYEITVLGSFNPGTYSYSCPMLVTTPLVDRGLFGEHIVRNDVIWPTR